MRRIPWDVEEAVALYDLYFRLSASPEHKEEQINALSQIYRKRAMILSISIDEKFRNETGLSMQLSCIQYVVTNGDHGLSGASKLFYQTYQLYNENPEMFNIILDEFYRKYSGPI